MSKGTKNNGSLAEPATVGDTYGNAVETVEAFEPTNRLAALEPIVADATLAEKSEASKPGTVAERAVPITEGAADAKSVADIPAPVSIETVKPVGPVETVGNAEQVALLVGALAGIKANDDKLASMTALEAYREDYGMLVADAESMNHTENELYSSFKVFSDCSGYTDKPSKEVRDVRKNAWQDYREAFIRAYPMSVSFCGRNLTVTKVGNEKPILNKVTGVVEKIRRTLTTEEYQSKREAIEYHARQLRRAQRS